MPRAPTTADVHDWVKAFEELWGHQLDRIKERAERASKGYRQHPSNPGKDKHENRHP
jgi:hypothetical protein